MARTGRSRHPRGSALLGRLGETLGGPSDRFDLALVEVTGLDAIGEQHPVALPVEPVGEDHLALGALGHAVQLHDRAHPVAHLEIELVGVRVGEGVRLPELHRQHSARSGTEDATCAATCDATTVGRGPRASRDPVSPGHDPAGQRYTRTSVKSSLETLEGNKVKLYVEVEEAEFEHDIDRACKVIAKGVRLPGFRNGKVPRKVLEARVGLAPAREQALRDAVPQYLAKAVREHQVDLIATPEVEITDGEEAGPVEFDATCEVRPVVSVAGYEGLRVELPSIEVSDDELTEARAAELRKNGELVDVDRPIQAGDYVTIDLAATRDGEEVMGLNTEDWSYEVGQGWVTDDFDDHLVGAAAGDELSFTSTPKGTEEPADFTVTVGQVQEMTEPELTDDWVSDHLGEFDTVEEWNDHLRESLVESKLGQARQQLVSAVTGALAGLVDLVPPEAMVNAELNQRVQGTVQQFQAQGIDLGQWLAATGQEPDQFVESMRGASVEAVKVDLALRAIADAESVEVEPHDLDAEYARMAMQYQQKAKDIRKAYEQNDAVPDLIAQIRKSKAFDWLLHHVDFVDPDGAPIDRDALLGHSHDDEGGHGDSEHDAADVSAAAAAVIAATDAAAANTDETPADDPVDDDPEPS